MKIDVLEELRMSGYNMNVLLNNPARFMSVAKIGPKKACEIYKHIRRPIPLKKLQQIYNQIDDKTRLQTNPKQPGTPIEKVSYPLHILQNKRIPLQDILAQFKVILGTTGQGKSNTVAVIIEEYIKYNLPVHIIDVEGEHLSFVKEKDFQLLNKRNYNPDKLEKFLKKRIKRGENLLVDFSSFSTEEESMEFLKDYLQTLWKLEDKLRRPLSIIVEEVHVLVPQGKNTPVKNILQDFAKRGRKRKIEAIFVTQRSQEADKSIITQAEIGFLHKVSHPANLAIYKVLIPGKTLYDQIPSMNRGEVIYVNKGEAIKDMVRKRETEHGSHTLSIKDLKLKDMEEITDAI